MMHDLDMLLNVWFEMVLFLFYINDCSAVECKKNADLGDLPGNTYYCDDPSKAECCEENQEFTCCEPASITTLVEQMTLWGTVIVVLLVVIMLVVCFRMDISYCSSEKTLKDKFLSIVRRTKNKKQEVNEAQEGAMDKPSTSSVGVGDKDIILNNAIAPHRTNYLSPDELADFHRYTNRRNSKNLSRTNQDFPMTAIGKELEAPVTARGVGINFSKEYTKS